MIRSCAYELFSLSDLISRQFKESLAKEKADLLGTLFALEDRVGDHYVYLSIAPFNAENPFPAKYRA